ncbi:MAG: class I SAM-dependent methyltransferase [Hyphomicrobiales bacterium]
MARRLETELLDILPADDPEASASRRDLRLVNRLMFSAMLVGRRLEALYRNKPAPKNLLDLGAGDGTLTLALAKKLSASWPGVEVTLLDRQDLLTQSTRQGFANLGWKATPVTADVVAYLGSAREQSYDIVVTNLFLHHFAQAELARLLALIARVTSSFIALEPRRARFPLVMSKLLWTIGCNRVTHHDAVASVRAGFIDQELSQLWPRENGWHLTEKEAWPFSHCFIARHDRACS